MENFRQSKSQIYFQALSLFLQVWHMKKQCNGLFCKMSVIMKRRPLWFRLHFLPLDILKGVWRKYRLSPHRIIAILEVVASLCLHVAELELTSWNLMKMSTLKILWLMAHSENWFNYFSHEMLVLTHPSRPLSINEFQQLTPLQGTSAVSASYSGISFTKTASHNLRSLEWVA